MRELNNTVFDTLVSRRPAAHVRVGRGSLAYDIIGAIAPRSVVGWMLGLGKKSQAPVEEVREEMASSQASLTWEKIDEEA